MYFNQKSLLVLIFFLYALSFVSSSNAKILNSLKPPKLLLAQVYSQKINLPQYWVSEKLDGVRAYWDGHHLISRKGNIYHAPHWFILGFPKTPLDGELWLGRGRFAELSGIVRQLKPKDELWKSVRFMVFDLPNLNAPFTQRLEHLKNLISKMDLPQLKLVEQFKIADHEQLMERLQQVLQQGGGGLMLHRGASYYQAGRSRDLIKVKNFKDAEAKVLAHFPGQGKFVGMMGSVLVALSDGTRFKIGTGFSELERKNPPPVGSTITFKYYGKTAKGIPRFASFLRVREEI